LKEYIVLFK